MTKSKGKEKEEAVPEKKATTSGKKLTAKERTVHEACLELSKADKVRLMPGSCVDGTKLEHPGHIARPADGRLSGRGNHHLA
jgi:hypothetical protein